MDIQIFRQAMSMLGAAVNVVTTDGNHGKGGFTATAVCSVSDSPATILFCLNKKNAQFDIFFNNETFAVNVLSSEHEQVSNYFGGSIAASIEDRFSIAEWKKGYNKAPVLTNSLCSIECKIVERKFLATHCIFFCEVTYIHIGNPSANLLYFNRKYHNISLDRH
ncbi:flavin reductase [Acinetobacter modestus]|uniref:flavin reductase n=1 Tax=Acinetobacter modestus TaxID=1776740 RepID=UPI00202EE185|nr:flavin reductase [Acinetobacter modestus]MCM1959129.1 flavin reductase [Acinetobacter modestus]